MAEHIELSNPPMEASVRELVTWVQSQETEVARAAGAKWAMGVLADVTNSLSAVRVSAVRTLWAEGWSLADISEALEISRARIHQIINDK